MLVGRDVEVADGVVDELLSVSSWLCSRAARAHTVAGSSSSNIFPEAGESSQRTLATALPVCEVVEVVYVEVGFG